MDLHGGDGDDEADEDEDDEPDEEEEVDIRDLDNEEEEEEEQEIPDFVAREAAAVRIASTQQQRQKPRLEAIVARTAAAKQNARKGKIEDREFKMTRGDGGMLRAVNN